MSKIVASVSKIRLLVALLLVGVVLIFLERTGSLNFAKATVSYLVTPIQLSIYRTFQNFSQTFEAVVSIGNLHSANAKLAMENAALKAENTQISTLESENKSLRQQLGSPRFGLLLKQVASVVGFGDGGNRDSLLIDKGSQSKIKLGDLVVVKNIYIGTISEVTPRTSRIRLITDPETKIPAVTESGALGVLVGQYGTEAHLANVIQDDKLNVGELVIASGEADFPKGLVLGKLASVKKVSRELFQDARVDSLLDLGKLQTVYVMGAK